MKKYKAGDVERSGPHRRIEGILDDMGLSYMSEERFLPYQVDILLPEFWVAIEVDGPFHSKSKDAIRDRFILEYYKVPIMRINAKRWLGKDIIKKEIIEFIEEWAETSEERKEECRKHRP